MLRGERTCVNWVRGRLRSALLNLEGTLAALRRKRAFNDKTKKTTTDDNETGEGVEPKDEKAAYALALRRQRGIREIRA